ncbi:hypothetical protein SA21251_1088 [Staphylococcus aureus subsp. aureus 21251]|nr:hypothetical protein SA21251_1088 [Staphylococcus aureus subsp. aureus 21251]
MHADVVIFRLAVSSITQDYENSISQNSEFLDKEISNFSNILLQYTFILSSFLKSINTIEERHSNAYQKGTLFVRSVSALTYHQHN